MLLRTYIREAIESVSITADIEDLAMRIGADVRTDSSTGNLTVQFHRGRDAVGYFRVSTVSLNSFEWPDDGACVPAWKQAGEPVLWVVRGAEWFDESIKNTGMGKRMYRILLDFVEQSNGVLAPSKCTFGGSTSPDANRVWQSLYRDFPNSKSLLRV